MHNIKYAIKVHLEETKKNNDIFPLRIIRDKNKVLKIPRIFNFVLE